VLIHSLIKIDLREPRRALAASLRDLRRARRLVVSDPEILGGTILPRQSARAATYRVTPILKPSAAPSPLALRLGLVIDLHTS
jgi:hypothetical protein